MDVLPEQRQQAFWDNKSSQGGGFSVTILLLFWGNEPKEGENTPWDRKKSHSGCAGRGYVHT